MKPLPLRPLPAPSEALTDYFERLACANGYLGLELWHILDQGDYSHPDLLSQALNGQPLPVFSGPSSPYINIPVNDFGLHPSDFTRVHRRWCPLCIEDSSWMRPIWRLKLATICATHRVHLLQQCPACHAYQTQCSILRGACECGIQFARVLVRAYRQEVRIAEILAKSLEVPATLDLGETAPLLNTPQIVRLVCYAGRLIEGPTLQRPGQVRGLEELPVASTLIAGIATLLADWPSSFWRCLERFVEAAPADASVRRVFSPLYQVIYQDLRDSVFQFLRDAFELFLLDHWRGELCGRHRLLNIETIRDHRHQGVARAARAAGVGSQTLRRLIHQDRFPANQFSPTAKRHLVTVDKEALAQLLPVSADYLDLRSTARLLGLKRSRLRQLVANGSLIADAKPNFGRSNRWHFRRSEIVTFLDDIRNMATSIPSTEDRTSLDHVLRYMRVSASELGSLIRAGRRGDIEYELELGGNLSKINFRSADLHAWLTSVRNATVEWVSVTRAAEILKLKEQVVYELVSRNLIVAEINAGSGHVRRRIALTSLQQFKQDFISVVELARLRNTSSNALLKAISVRPITGPSIDGGRQYFFRRTDIVENPCRLQHWPEVVVEKAEFG